VALQQDGVQRLLRIAAPLLEPPHQPGEDRPALLALRGDALQPAIGPDEGLNHLRRPVERLARRPRCETGDALRRGQAPGEVDNRVRRERVPVGVAVGPPGHQADLLQQRQVVRDGRFLELDAGRELLHAVLALSDEPEQLQPALVRQRLEDVEHLDGLFAIHHRPISITI